MNEPASGRQPLLRVLVYFVLSHRFYRPVFTFRYSIHNTYTHTYIIVLDGGRIRRGHTECNTYYTALTKYEVQLYTVLYSRVGIVFVDLTLAVWNKHRTCALNFYRNKGSATPSHRRRSIQVLSQSEPHFSTLVCFFPASVNCRTNKMSINTSHMWYVLYCAKYFTTQGNYVPGTAVY